jgi:glycosyltransferase involved in cell wall biosynthesis
MPHISIVMPSYNHARYLRRTIGSVIAQSFGDWEVVVVDDGSTDESLEVLKGFGEARISVHVNEKNLGTYGTLNRAMDLAAGEFVAVLNSDDLWKPEKLASQVALLTEHPEAAVCYTAPIQILEDDSPRMPQDHHGDWPTNEVQSLVSREIGVNRVLASSAVFRRGTLRFDSNYRYSGDWLAMLEAAAKAPFAFVGEPLTCWRIHDENAHKHTFGTLLEELAVRQSIVDAGRFWLQPHEDESSVLRALVENALRLNALYLLCGDRAKASRALKAATDAGVTNPTIQKRLGMSFLPLFAQRSRIWPGTEAGPYENAYKKGVPATHRFVT